MAGLVLAVRLVLCTEGILADESVGEIVSNPVHSEEREPKDERGRRIVYHGASRSSREALDFLMVQRWLRPIRSANVVQWAARLGSTEPILHNSVHSKASGADRPWPKVQRAQASRSFRNREGL